MDASVAERRCLPHADYLIKLDGSDHTGLEICSSFLGIGELQMFSVAATGCFPRELPQPEIASHHQLTNNIFGTSGHSYSLSYSPSVSPTVRPTAASSLTFTSVITLKNVANITSIDENAAARASIVAATALSENVSSSAVSYVSSASVTSFSLTATLWTAAGLPSPATVKVTLETSVTISSQTAGATLYTQLTAALALAVSSGKFTEYLREAAVTNGSPGLSLASATNVTSSTGAIVFPPSSSPKAADFSTITIIEIVIVVVLGGALIIGIALSQCLWKSRVQSKSEGESFVSPYYTGANEVAL